MLAQQDEEVPKTETVASLESLIPYPPSEVPELANAPEIAVEDVAEEAPEELNLDLS